MFNLIVFIGQHQEKKGLLLWKRCVNEKNLLVDVLDLKIMEFENAGQNEAKKKNLLFYYDCGHLHQLHGAFSIF